MGTFGAGVAYKFALNSGKRIGANVIDAADLDGDGRVRSSLPDSIRMARALPASS